MGYNGIPKNEKVWVEFTALNGDIFLTTTKEGDRSCYFLYKIINGVATKLGKAKDPIELEEKYIDT